jgi:hypothetical protein
MVAQLEDQLAQCSAEVSEGIPVMSSLIAARSEQCRVFKKFNNRGCTPPADFSSCRSSLSGHKKNMAARQKAKADFANEANRLAVSKKQMDASPPEGSKCQILKQRIDQNGAKLTAALKQIRQIVQRQVEKNREYTTYQKMKLCTQRTFGHKAGNIIWQIGPGKEKNCGVRGYQQ